MSSMKSLFGFIYIFLNLLLLHPPVGAFTLTSTHDTFGGVGDIVGPGIYTNKQELFEMVLRDLAFTNSENFVVPFFNNGAGEPNVCAEYDVEPNPDGRFTNALPFNEKADMCLANIAGTNMHIGVIADGLMQGQIQFLILDKQHLLVSMDIAFDLGIGEKGIIRLPFYGTTDRVMIPYSLQTLLNMPGGTDQAGVHSSGTWISGRFGDFNNDGWIDGTLVSAGNIPLESPVFPGQPYAMIRHFVLDVPAAGYMVGKLNLMSAPD